MKRYFYFCVLVTSAMNGAGALGFDTDHDGMPDDWEITFGFQPANPNDAALDADGDSFPNLDEYRCGTDPTNGQSRLQFTVIRFASPTLWELRFAGTTGVTYRIEYSAVLNARTWNHLVTTDGSPRPWYFPRYAAGSEYYRILASRSTDQPSSFALNIAGYVVLTALPGTNRLINPLFTTDHRVSSLIRNPPDGTLVIDYQGQTASYCPDLYETDWDNPNMVLPPGKTFTLVNPTTQTISLPFVGETLTPVLSTTFAGSRLGVRIIGASAATYELHDSSDLVGWRWLQNNAGPFAFTMDSTINDFFRYFRGVHMP